MNTLVPVLQHCRILALTGITGIGKTALAERLVVDIQDGKRFCRLNLDEGGITPDFSSSGAALLRSLGAEPTLDEQKDPQNLLAHLLQVLRTQPYRVQIDSLEQILQGDDHQGWSEFCDSLWLDLLQQFLVGSKCQSQIILTTQDLPGSLETVGSRYPHVWHCEPIRGLSATEQLELFEKRGLPLNDSTTNYLQRIGKLYAGHPLVLRVIAEDIKACDGDVSRYWQQGKFAEMETNRPAQLSRRKLQLRVKQQVKDALARLPKDALQLLCRSAVYRRSIPESFWLAMLPERPDAQAALDLLKSQTLAEEDWELGAWLGVDDTIPLRQHNLIRSVAYELLKADSSTWETAERKAAKLWLTEYHPAPDASNLEQVRGYLEAFHHFCEVNDCEKASQIILNSTPLKYELHKQLEIWGFYSIQISLYSQVLRGLNTNTDFILLKGLGNAHRFLSKFDQAIEWYKKGLHLAQAINDRRAEGEMFQSLGIVYTNLNDYEQALSFHNISLKIARSINYRELEGKALGGLGIVHYIMKNYDQALEYNQSHLEIARSTNDSLSEARALLSLGITHHLMRQYDQALKFYQQSLDISRSLNDLDGEGAVLNNMARTLVKLGRTTEALMHLDRAVTIFTEIGNLYAREIALKSLNNINKI